MSGASQQSEEPDSQAAKRAQQYMLSDEEIAYSLRIRPTGLGNWIKSLFGYGVTHWFVTNQRLIQDERFLGGFAFQDIPHAKVTSVEYGSKVPTTLLALGLLFLLAGAFLGTQVGEAAIAFFFLGMLTIAWAFYQRGQALIVHGSGGTSLSIAITEGKQVDELLLYLHAARNKQTNE